MSKARPTRPAGVLGCLVATVLASALTLGCDTGSSYEGDVDGDPGTDTSSSPTDEDAPVPGSVLPSLFGTPEQVGTGSSSDRWHKTEVTRDGLSYLFMANGWGPNFESQSVTWNGTAFTVDSMQGQQGAGYEPASYPTMFCGAYSDSRSGECGLPKALSSISSLRTGWRWSANGNTGEYNAAYDIWLSNSSDVSGHSSFLMIWLRDPPGQQPAGRRLVTGVSVSNAPGTWDIWAGQAGRLPIVNYVRREGKDSPELEVDVMDFVRDVETRQLTMPGSTVISVAVGFEIWEGPITGLTSQDFYVQVE
jgi:hypothetical protein